MLVGPGVSVGTGVRVGATSVAVGSLVDVGVGVGAVSVAVGSLVGVGVSVGAASVAVGSLVGVGVEVGDTVHVSVLWQREQGPAAWLFGGVWHKLHSV